MIRVFLAQSDRVIEVPNAHYFETQGGSLVLYTKPDKEAIALFDAGKWIGCEQVVDIAEVVS